MAIHLVESTSEPNIDKALKGFVGIFETAFPQRIRGYYVEGSYGDGTAIRTSDIDIVVLFKEKFSEGERDKAEQIIEYYDGAVSAELDIDCIDEAAMALGVPPSLKLGGTVLYGEPLPEHFPFIPVKAWARERMHAAYWLINKVFDRPGTVTPPLQYPKPNAAFYGYTERTVKLENGSMAPTTRDLIRVMGWAGTALIAYRGERVVARKKDCHKLYRQLIDDEWASFLESLYFKCRQEWGYLIPEEPNDRNTLKAICERALEFENYFIDVYREFVLAELKARDDSAKLEALERLAQIPFCDQEIAKQIECLSKSQKNSIRKQAAQTLDLLKCGRNSLV